MKTCWLSLLALLCALLASVHADDWPQWRGPQRNGVSEETGLLRQWPEGGPKLLWTAEDLGTGYSAPSVAGGRVYLLAAHQNEEHAVALNESDGKQLWSVRVGKVGENHGPQYPGPRSTPTVDGDLVFCLGSDGDLVCLDSASGKEHWRKNLKTDFGGVPGSWAYAESPLVDGDVVVCTPGGKEATMVALQKKTGEVFWKAQVPEGDAAAYASAVSARVVNQKMYVQFVAQGLIGVDATTGKPLWRYTKTIDPAANIPTPLVHDAFVFSTTGRNQGALIKLVPEQGTMQVIEVYTSKDLASSPGSWLRVGQSLYGTNSKNQLLCLEFVTGKEHWHDRSVGKGSLCYADERLYVRGEKGEMALVEATPEGYHEKGRFTQPQQGKTPTWPPPVVANGRLYLRDQGYLWCYDIKSH